MKSKPEPKSRPIARIAFAPKIGTDKDGNDELGSAREIGAVWDARTARAAS